VSRRPPKPTPEQTRAFQRMYDHFNRRLFDGELAPVLLNFSRMSRTYGFFAPERWRGGDGERGCHEISLNPAHLATREPREVASTLVHEMVHAWQHEHGSPSRAGYHNRQWAQKMEAVGLMPSATGEPGGKKTGQQMTHYIIEGGPFARAFDKLPQAAWFPWLCAPEADGPRARRRRRSAKSKTKYTCPSCLANVWGKPELDIRCGVCDELFEEAA